MINQHPGRLAVSIEQPGLVQKGDKRLRFF